MSLEDVVPTIMAAAGVPDVKEQLLEGYQAGDKHFRVHLDGYNQLPYLTGEVDESPRHEFFYYGEHDLYAIRYNNWKVHFQIKDDWFAGAGPADGPQTGEPAGRPVRAAHGRALLPDLRRREAVDRSLVRGYERRESAGHLGDRDRVRRISGGEIAGTTHRSVTLFSLLPMQPIGHGSRSGRRAAAVAGIAFSVLLTIALLLIRIAVPSGSDDPGTWVNDETKRR